MNFLIIDDDPIKVEKFVEHLDPTDTFKVFQSYNSGLKELIGNRQSYDCLILDMNFPMFDNGKIEVNTGIVVIRELERRRIYIPIAIYSSKYVDMANNIAVFDYIVFDMADSMESKVDLLKLKFSLWSY